MVRVATPEPQASACANFKVSWAIRNTSCETVQLTNMVRTADPTN